MADGDVGDATGAGELPVLLQEARRLVLAQKRPALVDDEEASRHRPLVARVADEVAGLEDRDRGEHDQAQERLVGEHRRDVQDDAGPGGGDPTERLAPVEHAGEVAPDELVEKQPERSREQRELTVRGCPAGRHLLGGRLEQRGEICERGALLARAVLLSGTDRFERPAEDRVLGPIEAVSRKRSEERRHQVVATEESLGSGLCRTRHGPERVHRVRPAGAKLEAGHRERLGEPLVLPLRVDDEGLPADPAAAQ